MKVNQVYVGDCRKLMRQMIRDGNRVQCIVTSPPYWGLRDYGVPGQFGLERTWVRHVARMRSVFRLCRELLADDGVLWLNYGDSYATGTSTPRKGSGAAHGYWGKENKAMKRVHAHGIRPKNLLGMPWRIAFALQEDGWYLRSDIIWHKPNPMPESVRDRPTKAHEYLFLLSKSDRYFYDFEASKEPVTGGRHARGNGVNPVDQGLRDSTKFGRGAGWRNKQNASFSGSVNELVDSRNMRTVWTLPTEAFDGAHFATFPRDLVRRCVLAGSRPGDVVFDPFMGSGTVAEVAAGLGRQFLGCELNPEYAALLKSHRSQQAGLAL